MDHHEQEYIRNPKFRDLEKEKKKERSKMKRGIIKLNLERATKKGLYYNINQKKKLEPGIQKSKSTISDKGLCKHEMDFQKKK